MDHNVSKQELIAENMHVGSLAQKIYGFQINAILQQFY